MLGERNSRMKDFYDLLLLSQTCEFDLLGLGLPGSLGSEGARLAGGPGSLGFQGKENRGGKSKKI